MVMPRSRSISIRIEHLLLHLAVLQSAGGLDQPVGEGGLAMVDVGDNGKVADVGNRAGCHARGIAFAPQSSNKIGCSGTNFRRNRNDLLLPVMASRW